MLYEIILSVWLDLHAIGPARWLPAKEQLITIWLCSSSGNVDFQQLPAVVFFICEYEAVVGSTLNTAAAFLKSQDF